MAPFDANTHNTTYSFLNARHIITQVTGNDSSINDEMETLVMVSHHRKQQVKSWFHTFQLRFRKEMGGQWILS
jgi:hypothetical protein